MECSKCGSINLVNKKLADQLVEEDILVSWKKKEMRLDPSELYYMFLDFNIFRTGTRTQTGEIEDIVINCKNFVVSQNVLLVKILELKCRELELERYIDEILGIRFDERDASYLVKEEFPQLFPKPKQLSGLKNYLLGLKSTSKSYTDFLRKVKLPRSKNLMFTKPGPYERDMKDRISKQYLKMSSNHFVIITGYLKEMMGVD